MDGFSGLNGTIFIGMKNQPMSLKTMQFIEEAKVRSTVFEEESDKPEISQRELSNQIFSRAFAEPHMSLEDLLPCRIMVCWRIVREMARIYRLVAEDETLSEALVADPDPWSIPIKWELPTHKRDIRQLPHGVTDVLRNCELMDKQFQISEYNVNTDQRTFHPGLPLLPPPVPYHWTQLHENGFDFTVTDDYDIENDYLLIKYIEWVGCIVEALQISEGSPEDPHLGRYGLMGILEPRTVRLAFPSRLQIITFEEILISETLESLVDDGVQPTKRRLYSKYGLTKREIEDLLKMARISARLQMEGDQEENRGLMLMRLESFVKRCKSNLDLRAELAGLKQVAIIQGLQRSEVSDSLADFLKVVGEVSHERDVAEAEFTIAKDATKELPHVPEENISPL